MGIGVAKQSLKKIFEPYYSTKEIGFSGSGLGLAVVYGILKDHKGYYDLFSGVGEGCEFILYFPVIKKLQDEIESDSKKFAGTEWQSKHLGN